jgi:hypothetical protein
MLHKLPRLFEVFRPKTVDVSTQTLSSKLDEEEMQSYFMISGNLITGNGIIQLNNQAAQPEQSLPFSKIHESQKTQEKDLKSHLDYLDMDQAIQDALTSAPDDPDEDSFDNILEEPFSDISKISTNYCSNYPSYASQWCTDYFPLPMFSACQQGYYVAQGSNKNTNDKSSRDSINPDAVADSNIQALKCIPR